MFADALSIVVRGAVLTIGAFALAIANGVIADANVRDAPRPAPATREDKALPSPPSLDIPKAVGDRIQLKVQHIRLEAGPVSEQTPSATLKFDMLNDTSSHLTNIVLEVSIQRKEESNTPQQPLVKPFIIREKVVLRPGYSMEYELRFQNLSADCGCMARVDVLSAESLADFNLLR